MDNMVASNLARNPKTKPVITIDGSDTTDTILTKCRTALKGMPAAYNELFERATGIKSRIEVMNIAMEYVRLK
jgi:hypothetical protein